VLTTAQANLFVTICSSVVANNIKVTRDARTIHEFCSTQTLRRSWCPTSTKRCSSLGSGAHHAHNSSFRILLLSFPTCNAD